MVLDDETCQWSVKNCNSIDAFCARSENCILRAHKLISSILCGSISREHMRFIFIISPSVHPSFTLLAPFN